MAVRCLLQGRRISQQNGEQRHGRVRNDFIIGFICPRWVKCRFYLEGTRQEGNILGRRGRGGYDLILLHGKRWRWSVFCKDNRRNISHFKLLFSNSNIYFFKYRISFVALLQIWSERCGVLWIMGEYIKMYP